MYNNGGIGDDFRSYVAEYFYFNSYDSVLIGIRENLSHKAWECYSLDEAIRSV